MSDSWPASTFADNMSNLRIIHDNAADRATISASTTAGPLLAAANMQNDFKGQVHRSVGGAVTYTLSWATTQSVGGVAFPATNFTVDATVRVRLYSDAGGTALVADSGTIYACPGLNLGLWDWSLPLNCNAFAFGGASKSAVWFDSHYAVRLCVIDVYDYSNSFIDCSRLVVGAYWSPTYNADYGAKVSVNDLTSVARNDSGDLLPDNQTKYDTMKLNLAHMPEADRARLMMIFRGVGTGKNLFVSALPRSLATSAEQDFMIYGKRQNSDVSFDHFDGFSNSMQLEGW
jgi:hypothetical protein